MSKSNADYEIDIIMLGHEANLASLTSLFLASKGDLVLETAKVFSRLTKTPASGDWFANARRAELGNPYREDMITPLDKFAAWDGQQFHVWLHKDFSDTKWIKVRFHAYKILYNVCDIVNRMADALRLGRNPDSVLKKERDAARTAVATLVKRREEVVQELERQKAKIAMEARVKARGAAVPSAGHLTKCARCKIRPAKMNVDYCTECLEELRKKDYPTIADDQRRSSGRSLNVPPGGPANIGDWATRKRRR